MGIGRVDRELPRLRRPAAVLLNLADALAGERQVRDYVLAQPPVLADLRPVRCGVDRVVLRAVVTHQADRDQVDGPVALEEFRVVGDDGHGFGANFVSAATGSYGSMAGAAAALATPISASMSLSTRPRSAS